MPNYKFGQLKFIPTINGSSPNVEMHELYFIFSNVRINCFECLVLLQPVHGIDYIMTFNLCKIFYSEISRFAIFKDRKMKTFLQSLDAHILKFI